MFYQGGERQFLTDYYRNVYQSVTNEIMREDDKTIIGSNTEELVEYYYQKYALVPITEDPDKEASFDPQKYVKTVRSEDREYGYRGGGDLSFEYEKIVVEIPLLPNPTIETINRYTASSYSISYSQKEYHFGQDKVWFEFDHKGYGFKYEDSQIASEISSRVGNARSIMQNKNTDINSGNTQLKTVIRDYLKQRVEKLKQDSSKVETLSKLVNIPLKKKEGSHITPVRVTVKPAIAHIKPSPTQPEDYRLDESMVLQILNLVEEQGKQFERTPQSFKPLGEEALRDIILSALNSVFEGSATGETFSKNGKTDIYLRIDKGNILIFECKIWGGETLYQETINQLRGYVNWRHNFGVMITFARNKDFSKILTQTEGILKTAPSYKGGFKKVSETHYISKHSLDEDMQKEVQIHHLFFNLFAE